VARPAKSTLGCKLWSIGDVFGRNRDLNERRPETGSLTRSSYDSSMRILVNSSVLLGILVACAAHAPADHAASHVPQLADTSGQSYFANAHPYLEEPLEKLIERIPELRSIRPVGDQKALPLILGKTGTKVEEFFERIVDLTAHEEITQERLNAKGSIKASRRLQYNYLILIHRLWFACPASRRAR
jgi:hypothetical protein